MASNTAASSAEIKCMRAILIVVEEFVFGAGVKNVQELHHKILVMRSCDGSRE